MGWYISFFSFDPLKSGLHPEGFHTTFTESFFPRTRKGLQKHKNSLFLQQSFLLEGCES